MEKNLHGQRGVSEAIKHQDAMELVRQLCNKIDNTSRSLVHGILTEMIVLRYPCIDNILLDLHNEYSTDSAFNVKFQQLQFAFEEWKTLEKISNTYQAPRSDDKNYIAVDTDWVF